MFKVLLIEMKNSYFLPNTKKWAIFYARSFHKNAILSPLFFHGSLTVAQREEFIEKFQTDKDTKVVILFIESRRNRFELLTSATNVIHYDLWWNPAAEDQATDRTYRIGQDKNVMVHRMITLWHFEEKN